MHHIYIKWYKFILHELFFIVNLLQQVFLLLMHKYLFLHFSIWHQVVPFRIIVNLIINSEYYFFNTDGLNAIFLLQPDTGDTEIIKINTVHLYQVQLKNSDDNSVSKYIKNKITYSSKIVWEKQSIKLKYELLLKLNKSL